MTRLRCFFDGSPAAWRHWGLPCCSWARPDYPARVQYIYTFIYIYTHTYGHMYIYINIHIYIYMYTYTYSMYYIYASLPLRSTFWCFSRDTGETHCILQRKSKNAVSLISIPSRKLFELRLRSSIGIWYFKYCRKVCRNLVCTKFSWKKHQIPTQYQGVWWKHWQCFSSNNKQHSEKKYNMWKDAIHPL